MAHVSAVSQDRPHGVGALAVFVFAGVPGLVFAWRARGRYAVWGAIWRGWVATLLLATLVVAVATVVSVSGDGDAARQQTIRTAELREELRETGRLTLDQP